MDAITNKIANYNPQIMSTMGAGVLGSSALKVSSTLPETKASGFSEDAVSLEISTEALDAYKKMYDSEDSNKLEIPSEAVQKQIEEAIEAAKERAEEMEEFRTGLREEESPDKVTAFAGYSMGQIKDMYYDGRIDYDTYTDEIDIKKSRIENAMLGSGE